MGMNINKIRNELSGIYAKIDEDLKTGDEWKLADDITDMIIFLKKIKVEIK